MKSPVDGATRRSLLRTIGAGVVATSVVAGSASAQDGVAERFEFEGETSGWVGVAPSDIEGETNPALSLEAGSTYEFHWENADGDPHNVVIEDADGNNIVESEYVSSEGETQTVEFTASEEMASYYCGAHPSSMRGDVELSGGSASTATGTESGTETEDGTETESGTETEEGTETEGGTETGTGGETHEVLMVTDGDEYYFDPIGLHVEPGDTIEWTIDSGSHNAVSYDERIPEDAETFDTEVISEGSHELSFSTEGTYDYYCMPHQSLGMVGRFVVGEPGGPAEGSMPEHGDVPEASAIVEQGSISYEEFSSGESGGDGTATDEPTPTGTADEEVTEADPDEQNGTTEADGPGFTVVGALSAIGAGALLRAYRNREE